MKKPMLLLPFIFVLISCGPHRHIPKSELKPIDKNIDLVFRNIPEEPGGVPLSRLFGIDQNDSVVRINFDQDGDLKISFKNFYLGGKAFRGFKGKFRKNAYQVYLKKKNIIFPPVYWVTNVNRLRLSFTKDSVLVVEQYYNSSGMVMLFSAGRSWNVQYSYKLSKTESVK